MKRIQRDSPVAGRGARLSWAVSNRRAAPSLIRCNDEAQQKQYRIVDIFIRGAQETRLWDKRGMYTGRP